MMLRGYRGTDLPLLTGPWLPGELLGLPVPGRPALAEPTTVPPPDGPEEEVCVVAGTGFVRYTALDWVHRRARLEIGLRPGAADAAEPLLKAALAHAFRVLNLRRVHGWVTPAVSASEGLMRAAGLLPEADLPRALWLDGRPVARQIWGVTRHG